MTTTSTDSTPQWAFGCPTCKAIWLQFSDPESASEINLGSSEEALSTTCPNHKVLLERFNDYGVSQGPHDESFNDISIAGFQKPRKGSSIAGSQLLNKVDNHWSFLLAKKDDVPRHPGNRRILDTDWTDVETSNKWKHRCITSYGTNCENPLKSTGDYFTCLQRVINAFRFATPEFSDFASPIIRHAMYLTTAIDERYLWADALCATQYDLKAASEQSKSMGAVYANVIVTIIATDGDSGSGISDLKGISDPRGLIQNVILSGTRN
ncbi:hypothetical protein FVEG_17081 [Fusarium verticillioides 7600]|uniref:Heterokaryon incompatibility domain-containing protein n=1 Tax=Gibberella moniliformis (strain M3125 / FGSC 7600) TaxID=334819 RepID=W7MQ75_GIBM7|nr:hypothetical protein FVEG_17081 [Fusarium verticillioides 7600]EWG53256.1 hypothetical protein FVEG_17081 [Fusarium verticillioides 7600]